MKPDNFTDAYSRIQAATGTKTQTDIAKLLGIKQSSISDAKKKNTIPDGWLVTLYRTCGLEPDWILYGQAPISSRRDVATPASIANAIASSKITVYAMARIDPETGAWLREGIESIPLIESLARPKLLVVKMDNTSMEPAIRRNAYVGIDCDDTRIRSGEVFALDILGEGLVIKRLVHDLGNKRLTIIGDNPTHQAQYSPLDNPGITLMGRAIWIIQEI